MTFYADLRTRRIRQLAGDLLLVVWVAVWVRIAVAVHDATLSLAVPGERLADAGTDLAARLRDAGDAVGGVPVVGDDARAPFEGAGQAAEQMAGAGAAQVEAVGDLAFWLGLSVAAIPVLIAVAVYLPPRARFVRAATAGRRLIDADGDVSTGSGDHLDLFALRALARQPLDRLARVSDDPAGAWRSGDREVVRNLAALELRDAGLRAPR